MPSVIPNEGQEWVSEKMMDLRDGEKPYYIALGDGSSAPTESDTSLDNEIYRADDDMSNCTVEATTNTGEIVARITVSGGTELSNPPQDVSELGLIINDGSTLLYREVRGAVTIESGDRQTFEFKVRAEDG